MQSFLNLLFVVLIAFSILSCQSTSVKVPSSPENPAISTEINSDNYSLDELVTMGFSITDVDKNQKLLCGVDANNCICLQPLDCRQENNCPSLNTNLNIFEAALDQSSDVTVDCKHASVGQCGKFKYFQFNGDNHKREMRWFDMNNQLVGIRNATDYPAYCGNKTRILYQGKIPKCEKSVQTRHICGEQWSHGLSPIKTLGL